MAESVPLQIEVDVEEEQIVLDNNEDENLTVSPEPEEPVVNVEEPETQLTTTGPVRKRLRTVKFVDEQTSVEVKNARLHPNGCKLCSFTISIPDKLTEHIRTHFTRFFCSCGVSENIKSLIGMHIQQQKRNLAADHQDITSCYEVDRTLFQNFLQFVGLPDSTAFGELVHRKDGARSIKVETVTAPATTSNDASSLSVTFNKRNRDVRLLMNEEESTAAAASIRAGREQKQQQSHKPSSARVAALRPALKRTMSGSVVRPSTPFTAVPRPTTLNTATTNVHCNAEVLVLREELKRVTAERDRLREENIALRVENQGARQTIGTVQEHLSQIQQIGRHLGMARDLIHKFIGN